MALCAGVGGLELGLALAVPEYRTVCYVEREAYAVAVLVSRMAEGLLDEALVWDDVRTFNGNEWRGRVDIISSGFPCQPFSSAGKRLGTADDRWLWEYIALIIDAVRPRYVFLENVPDIAFRGLDRVLGSLALLGFDAEWGVFSAKALGAPHLRRRLFLLAHANRSGQPKAESLLHEGQQDADRCDNGDGATTDTHSLGRNGRAGGSQAGRKEPENENRWLPAPDVPRVDDGFPPQVDRIRACGNAVVPAVAARAFTELRERLGD